MADKEFSGLITSVEATSSHVKVHLDTVPDKRLIWLMTQFLEKPRPEVGKQLTCTARSGPHNELHVQRLISITDPSPEVLRTEVHRIPAPVDSSLDPTLLPLPSKMTTKVPDQAKPIATILADRGPPSGSLDELAAVIVDLRDQYEKRILTNLLELKWLIGRETGTRRVSTEESYRELEQKTGVNHEELRRCVAFYEKFLSKGYELKAWRKVVAELPAGKEPVEESAPALVVDEKHLWECPECGQKFEHVHVSENKHRLQECKAD